MGQQTGWLVESKHPTTKQPEWLGISRSYGGNAVFRWTSAPNEALRLCRLEDATRLKGLYTTLEGDYSNPEVTEHVWVDGMPPNSPVSGPRKED